MLTYEKKSQLRAELAKYGWVTCPCCGWIGLQVTKARKIRKHGRAQTGNENLGCQGSGLTID